LQSTKWSNGEKKKGWKPFYSKKKTQYRIQWEMKEMDNQFLSPTKQFQMSLRRPMTPTKKPSKRKSWKKITEKFMKKILNMVNHNIQDALKKFQDTKNKEHEKTQKQINKLKEDFNKHQSETKDTIKKRCMN
jgi:hypothetical protein